MSSGAGWAVTSIERTAYPRFKRLITAHELHLFFTPSRDEVEWASALTSSDEHLLALLLALKSYQRMGCLPKLDEVPDTVIDFVRRAIDLPEGTVPRATNRTAERQRTAERRRTGLSYDKVKAPQDRRGGDAERGRVEEPSGGSDQHRAGEGRRGRAGTAGLHHAGRSSPRPPPWRMPDTPTTRAWSSTPRTASPRLRPTAPRGSVPPRRRWSRR
ncbi:DUF4158 domain-containing protein [Streptomyces sp. NPDC005336]|uniref:DUF4158 domain-containing protein n=1 Tax=Streptomyces sp. NPDC005336 TaxID=3157035 RepID=UPI0033B6B78F